MEVQQAVESEELFLPFSGLSAWFSTSVHPDLIKQWDYYGGQFAGVDSANYLFSDNAQEEDTIAVYNDQADIVVFKPDWIAQVVLLHKPVSEVAVGKYFLLPHFCDPLAVSDSPQFHTPERPSLPPLSAFTMRQYRLGDAIKLEEEEEKVTENAQEQEESAGQGEEEEAIEQPERKEPTKENAPTCSNSSGVSIVFPLKGNKYDVVHIEQLEPPDALHIDLLGPITTSMVDFTPNANGYSIQRCTEVTS